MADGDIVRGGLAGLYLKPYKALCQEYANSDECTRSLISALKKDIQRKGDLPVRLAKQMGESIDQAINNSAQSGLLDWAAENRKVEKIVQQTDGRHDLKELTLRAGKNLIQFLRYGGEVVVTSTSKIILQRYMEEVCDSEFRERIPLTSENHAGIDHVTIAKSIEKMQSDISSATSEWADRASKDGSMINLRMPRHQIRAIDMEEDLAFSVNKK
jgi:hypothetical protein